VPDVTLSRQKSAMIPILSDGLKVRRLSIYNQSVLSTNPLLGARLTNTTGKLLPQGPLTVLDAGVYAGDAKIDDLPNGQNRLFSYGIDQQVLVHGNEQNETSEVVTAKINRGVLEVTNTQLFTQKYVAENKGKTDRTLLIEHPRRINWNLIDTAKPVETTDALYRFDEALPAGKTVPFVVKEQLTSTQGIAILPMDTGAMENYRQTGPIPQKVKDALGKAAQLKYAMVDTQRQIQDRQQHLTEYNQEQTRIRENMKAVSPNTDYYKRLLKELDDQETTIQKLQTEIKTLQEKFRGQQKELEDYLANLTV
jgi:DNA repair exonuclease SbcCD ATPase subunit